MNGVTVPGQMLVHRVINYLIYQMVQTLSRYRAYVHTRAGPDRLESLKHRYGISAIFLFPVCHILPLASPHLFCDDTDCSALIHFTGIASYAL